MIALLRKYGEVAMDDMASQASIRGFFLAAGLSAVVWTMMVMTALAAM